MPSPRAGNPAASRLRNAARRLIALVGKARTDVLGVTVGPGRLARSIVHVHGDPRIEYGPEEVILISVVRNGALYLDAFLEHHLAMGVKHIVLLDNASTDGTPERASRHDRVTVLSTDLPYGQYENVMKNYLARRFSPNRWNLCCDIDELFDYPGSDRMPLSGLLRYLNAGGYSAVVAQMLDMVADCPLSDLIDRPGPGVHDAYDHYDLTHIEKVPYRYADPPVEAVKMHFGGIRKAVFGSRNGLTKAALVRVRDDIQLFRHWHHTRNARVADVTCVLRHYPFTGAFYEKVKEAVETDRYAYLMSEYHSYWSVLERNPGLNLKRPGARRYEGTDQLVDEGYLIASDAYRDYVRAQTPGGG